MSDFDEIDDEITEDDEDDESDGDSGIPDQEQRIAAYEKKVAKQVYILSKPRRFKSDTRVQAARMLGELGEPKAIKPLIAVYENDKDPAVQAAARESLQMFRSLQEALDDEDTAEYAMNLINRIVLEGKEPAQPMNRRLLTIVAGGLFVSFLIFMGLGLLLGGGGSPAQAVPTSAANVLATEVEQTLQAELADPQNVALVLQDRFGNMVSNIRSLQDQMQTISRGETPDCEAEFIEMLPLNLPPPITAADYPDLVTAYTRLEDGVTQVNGLINTFQTQCNTITGEDALAYDDELIAIQRDLSDVPQSLVDAGFNIPNAPTPLPTLTPTLTPTPTLDPALIDRYDLGAQSILDDMIGTRGNNTVLIQYWNSASEGNTLVCNQLPPPVLPSDFVIVQQDEALVPQALLDARDNINTGLALSRDSWTAFAAACSAGTVSSAATRGLQLAETADTAFQDAQQNLDDLTGN